MENGTRRLRLAIRLVFTEFNHTFKHTYRFFFAFALAVRTLAAAFDAFVAISFRRSGDSRSFRDFAPFFPIVEK
jgi:hypothetical protein